MGDEWSTVTAHPILTESLGTNFFTQLLYKVPSLSQLKRFSHLNLYLLSHSPKTWLLSLSKCLTSPGVAGWCSSTHMLPSQVLATKLHPPTLRSKLALMFKEVKWTHVQREGKDLHYYMRFSCFSWSISGFLSLISSGISILHIVKNKC